MGGEPFALSPENACAYLRSAGRIAPGQPCAARRLGGGVSNEVLMVDAGERWVLKQALPRLRVAAEWLADAGRSEVEARCLQVLSAILPAGAVPALVFSDAGNHVLAMTAAPAAARNLKEILLAGQIDAPRLRQAGALLAMLQAGTRGRPDVRARFSDLAAFRQLRLDPYYGEVARRHPRLAAAVRGQAAQAAGLPACLVHGDYSPKNMLVHAGSVVLLDFEVAHWGCRAFDPAFFLNHLLLKALHRPGSAAQLLAGAQGFWSAYRQAAAWPDGEALEAEVVGHLGCLLLARVDGKSPVEYIRDEPTKAAVRRLGAAILEGGWRTLARVAAAVGAA